jgi:hypothetical protein
MPSRDPWRPSSLTPAVAESLAVSLRAGMSRSHAAARAGVSKRSVFGWVSRGRAERDAGMTTRHTRFVGLVEMSEVEATFAALRRVKAGGDDWQAGAWFLGRTRAEWARCHRREATTDPGRVARYVLLLPEKSETPEAWAVAFANPAARLPRSTITSKQCIKPEKGVTPDRSKPNQTTPDPA